MLPSTMFDEYVSYLMMECLSCWVDKVDPGSIPGERLFEPVNFQSLFIVDGTNAKSRSKNNAICETLFEHIIGGIVFPICIRVLVC